MSIKKTILFFITGLLWLLGHAQTYPSRTINLIVPFPPGGSTDLIARALAQQLSSQMGQPMVVDNKPGAGGGIGTNLVAKAHNDGYTLLFTTSSTHALGPSLNKNLPYNVDTDFVPVIHMANASHILLVSKSVPASN